jgi:hypothetical protein
MLESEASMGGTEPPSSSIASEEKFSDEKCRWRMRGDLV